MKKIITTILVVTVLLTSSSPTMVLAERQQNKQRETTQQVDGKHQGDKCSGVRAAKFIREAQLYPVSLKLRKSAPATTLEWNKYSSNYNYLRMSVPEQKFYDSLRAMCQYYAVGNIDCGTYMDGVSYEGLNLEEAFKVVSIFSFQNPQYFFMNSAGNIGYNESNKTVALSMYENFKDGDIRKVATDTMFSRVGLWEKEILGNSDPVQQEKKAHDLICHKVIYEEGTFDQSCYSVFCGDRTVCAGYAQAFALIMNSIGIETLSVTSAQSFESEGHEWNQIKLFDTWYNIDLTWDDGEDGKSVQYLYFNRSDEAIAEISRNDMLAHTIEAFWQGKVPKCKKDSGATSTSIGTVIEYTGIQKIKANDIVKEYGEGDFNINAESSDPTSIITYEIKNTEIADVDAQTGYVTVKNTGKTEISIHASETETSPEVQKLISLTVKPQKVIIQKVSTPTPRSILIKWEKQDKISGYQIQYSTKSKFTTARSLLIKNISTTTRKIIGLKVEKGYFVRIRAYKINGQTKVYSDWSTKNYVVTKK